MNILSSEYWKSTKMNAGYLILLIIISFSLGNCLKNAAAADDLTYDACINNTWDEAECKDCCDCLDADANTRKNCRDTCATHDFYENDDFITVVPESELGPDGDYSQCVGTGSEAACKECCDGSDALRMRGPAFLPGCLQCNFFR